MELYELNMSVIQESVLTIAQCLNNPLGLTVEMKGIIQTTTVIFSQSDSNKFQSCPPIGHLMLLKYKTDFPVFSHNFS